MRIVVSWREECALSLSGEPSLKEEAQDLLWDPECPPHRLSPGMAPSALSKALL